jgi:small subunit ribosomal protein S6
MKTLLYFSLLIFVSGILYNCNTSKNVSTQNITQETTNKVEKKEMGLKDLAYEIDHHKKGYYVWLKVKANNEAIAEFNRVIRITEDVIRFIVVKEGE